MLLVMQQDGSVASLQALLQTRIIFEMRLLPSLYVFKDGCRVSEVVYSRENTRIEQYKEERRR